jgi:Acyl-CoA thioesterase N-terminal domain
MSVPDALFERDGSTLLPTTLCRGPWDHGCLHGGAVCGAVGWALEQARADDALVLARATVEIRSMVPLGPLRTDGMVVKPGRRTQVIEATLTNDTGVVARATSQWVLPHPREAPSARQAVPARPAWAADPGAVAGFDYPRPGFNCDAVELRPLHGTTETAGRDRSGCACGSPSSRASRRRDR